MKRKHARGFSMIEVLVTLLLLCIGILGMVALQGRAIQFTQDATQRNTAAALANDLVEMMRAMPNENGFYKNGAAALPGAPSSCNPLPANAGQQLACWAQRATQSLPGASDLWSSDFHVCRSLQPGTCSSGNTIEIQLAWRGRSGECLADDSNTASDTCRYRLRTQL